MGSEVPTLDVGRDTGRSRARGLWEEFLLSVEGELEDLFPF